MIKRSEFFLKQCVLLLDVAVLVAAFLATHHLRQSVHAFYRWDLVPGEEIFEPLRPLDSYLWLLLIILPLWIGWLSLLGGYRELRIKSYPHVAGGLVKACGLTLLLFGSFVFLLKLSYVSRTFIVLFFLTGLLFLAIQRAVLMFCFRVMLHRGYFYRNLLIVGTGRRARQFAESIRQHANWGLRIAGFLDEDARLRGQIIDGIEVLGTPDDMQRLLQERTIDEVIFVVPRSWLVKTEPAILQCELGGVRATVAVDLFNMMFAKVHPSDLAGVPLISYEPTQAHEWQRALKRFMDLVVSCLGLVVLSPAFLVIAVLIKGTSPGPVFFKQVRCGLSGRRFLLYKFRSMVAGAESRQKELKDRNEMGGPAFKVANDPRLTPLGRWLRKVSADELPQLFNVLRGEMSLVGPRPPVPSEVEKYEPWQRRRLSMRPGMTGYWQVSGRNQIRDFNKWMELDLEYIDQWSLRLDARILLKTIPTVLLGIGAE